jgi:hypothetical protein
MKNEVDLAYEIKNLDDVLNKNMHYLDGFLFSTDQSTALSNIIAE